MDYETLMALLGENAEAKAFVEQVRTDASKNVETIGTLERKVTEISATRDKYKGYLGNVKSKLGLEKLNDDTLSAVANNKGGDEALKSEIDGLKNQLQTVADNSKQEQEALQARLRDVNFDREMLKLGVTANAVNDHAFATIMRELKTGADFNEDGSIVFKKDDGTTRYIGGKEMGLADRLEEIKASDTHAYLFKRESAGGAGGGTGNGGGAGGTGAGIAGDKNERTRAIQARLEKDK